ncbi:MAG: SRPBCC domain-containing protein [Spirochaetia bacterium]|nr:SRPBCC domain-containing protein [Spirochaetia bacterium]
MKEVDIEYEIYIGAPVESVWNALSNPAMVKKLYYGSVLRSTFEPGSAMEYVGPGPQGPETVHIYGKIVQFRKNQEFTHTCKVGSAYGADRINFESRVSYKLEAVGKTTKLSILHNSWMAGDPAYTNTKIGWPMVMSALKSAVESGMDLDFGDRGH